MIESQSALHKNKFYTDIYIKVIEIQPEISLAHTTDITNFPFTCIATYYCACDSKYSHKKYLFAIS